MNQNLVKFEASRSLTYLERQTLAMLHRLVFAKGEAFYRRHAQSPQSVLGIVTSGATLANLTGLWIARNRRLSCGLNGNGIEQEGVSGALRRAGYAEAAIIGSRLMHYSIQKAAGILGLGEQSVLTAPTDADGRVDVAACRDLIRECEREGRCVLALVGVAGTTDCGSVDPLEEMAELAREHRTHFHVDAAWGAPLLFSPAYRGLLAGIEKADTVTIDGHKQFYVPVGVGVLLLGDSMAARVIEKRSPYMLQHGTSDLGHQSAEGSRPATALLLHAALSVIGPEGFELLMGESIRKARHLARRISESEDFELLMRPATNIVLYRYLPGAFRGCRGLRETPRQREEINAFNERLQRAQFEGGRALVSRTRLEDGGAAGSVTALRAVVANPLSREEDLDHLLEDQRRVAGQLSPQAPQARRGRAPRETRAGGA
jgi:glutamate decarboxylase